MDLTDVDGALSRLAERQQFSGAVLVRCGGEVLLDRGYGLASHTWGVPATSDTRFDTASITKLFTAVAVLQQVRAGAFALTTAAVDYLGLEGTTISSGATVHHLLSHTSGIGDDADEEAGESYEALFRDRPSYSVRDAADLLPGFAQKPANFAPGEGCRYCNAGYVLLGMMVERATGTAYRDYVRQHILTPAGMTRSGFFAMDRVEADVAEGVEPVRDGDTIVGWRRNIYSYPPIGTPDGGAHCTVGDLVRFHDALLDGSLLERRDVDLMLAPHGLQETRDDGVEHWVGYGFEFERNPDGSTRSWWKEGINVGASGILRHYPASGTTLAVLSNLEDGAWGPISLLDDALTN